LQLHQFNPSRKSQRAAVTADTAISPLPALIREVPPSKSLDTLVHSLVPQTIFLHNPSAQLNGQFSPELF
ncbi:hypothetical protein GBAR_LOCUS20171, partial [Geodia barretti]